MTDQSSLAIAVAVLLALLLLVGWVGRLGQNRDALVVVVRAVVQLAVVGFVIRAVFVRPALAPVYLTLMVGVAAYTSSRRLRGVPHAFGSAAVAIAIGATTVCAVVIVTGALPRDARDLVPFAAQVIGGTMTATTLAALRMRDDVLAGWELVEAFLAIGASPRQAVADVSRRSAGRALVPALDQTRNVGLVVLPGLRRAAARRCLSRRGGTRAVPGAARPAGRGEHRGGAGHPAACDLSRPTQAGAGDLAVSPTHHRRRNARRRSARRRRCGWRSRTGAPCPAASPRRPPS